MAERTLFITGASSGIGAETARQAVAQGWNVGLFARSAEKLDALVGELGDKALALPGDASQFREQEKALDTLAAHFGDVTAAFANAGRGASSAGTLDGDPEDWQSMVNLNVMGVLWTAKAIAPYLRKNRGHLVLTGSAAGRMNIKGSVYSATKWFVQGYAGNLAEEFREWGARVTVISPGMVDTPFFDEAKPDKLKPEDIAASVLFALEADPRASVREIFVMPTN